MSMQEAHAAAAKLLAGEGDAGDAPTLPDGGTPPAKDTTVDVDAQVDAVLREIGVDDGEPPTAEPGKAPVAKAADPWEALKGKYKPDEVQKALDYDANARAALHAADRRNSDAAERLARAEQLETASHRNLLGLGHLARRDPDAAVKILLDVAGDEGGSGGGDDELFEVTAEDGSKVKARLPAALRARLARVDDIDQRLGAYETHSFTQGVRGLVSQLVAKEPIFGEMGVVDDVTSSLVASITSSRGLRADQLEARAAELVAAAAKRSRAINDGVIERFVKAKGADAKKAAPAMRGGGGTPPREPSPKLPRLGKNGVQWSDIHKLAGKVRERLADAGIR